MSIAIKPVVGSNLDDTLIGTHANEVMSGQNGDDLIYGRNGHDEIYGGSGNDELHGQSGDDIIYGNGRPNYANLDQVQITENYSGQLVFEGESAGYKNSLGSYKIDENGVITDVNMHFSNASLQHSGGDLIAGQSSSSIELNAGDKLGFFIISNGFNGNNQYENLDFSTGTLQFRDSNGDGADMNSSVPELWFTSQEGEQTKIVQNIYHANSGTDDTYNLNPDGINHVVGLLNTNKGEIRLGFEDLYNGGDKDFDDCVFTLDCGIDNARAMAPTPSSHVISTDDDVLLGGNGDDELYGRSGDDVHYGNSGDDEIYAGSGDDWASGGSGDDILKGGSGVDYLYGDSNNDQLFGGLDNDFLFGGSGDDQLNGNSGDDFLSGESGADLLKGGTGNDHLDGGSSNDTLYGNSGDDTLLGDSGADKLYGGNGNDHLDGGSSSDTLYGNSGDDTLLGDSGADKLYGGNGHDVVYGGVGNDQVNGNSGDDQLFGDGGADTVKGGNGNDTISGGAGNDNLYGNSGNDVFTGDAGRDYIHGGSGTDLIDYSSLSSAVFVDLHNKRTTGGDSDTFYAIENTTTTSFDDEIRGDLRDNTISAGAGDDFIRGAKGDDQLTGGEGDDIFYWKPHDLNSVDDILDFSLTDDWLQLDFDMSEQSLDSYITLTEVSGSTVVSVDLDGSGDQFESEAFVQLDGLANIVIDDLQFIV